VIERDVKKMRGLRPFMLTDLEEDHGVAGIAACIERAGGLAKTDSDRGPR
jgi:Ni2+-binding GTPase involved in maturation of urease and hydrogenase